MDALLKYLRQHSITCAPGEGGKITALEHYTVNCVGGSRWVQIDATWSAVRDWLGY